MKLNSFIFILFMTASLLVYYSISSRNRPLVLLTVSFIYLASCDIKSIFFLLAAAFIIWRTALLLNCQDKSDKDTALKKRDKRRILVVAIIILAGTLILLKYILPVILPKTVPGFTIGTLIPLGISYYTLQCISYIADVYWGRIEAEKKFLNVLLFTAYFPQILQGPISRYADLSKELYLNEHKFDIKNIKFGVQLVLWGYLKVFVIREHAARFVNRALIAEESTMGLAAFLELVLFGIELYCDFSGGIDIIRGISQCFAVNLPENFKQPFFSKSLGEFWRRWHITLGTWMKDYIFFPFSMSKPISKFKKKAKKHISRKWVNRFPIALANIVVFLIVGAWHGLGTNYMLWGLYNGIILAVSELLVDVYKKSKAICHINDQSIGWHIFSIVRTFIIVTLGWCTDCASTADGALMILKNMLYIQETNFEMYRFRTIDVLSFLFVLIILIIVDVLHERKVSVREKLNKLPTACQMLLWIIFIQIIAVLGRLGVDGGFIYANF